MPAVEVPSLPFWNYPTTLGNHTAATPSQSIEIRGVISMIQSRVSQINEDLAHLKILRKQLFRKRDEALTCINQYKSLLAPIRRLPAELLAAIFCFCLPPQEVKFDIGFSFSSNTDHVSFGRRQAPLLLGRVCSLWRAVALSTPSLWSSFGASCTTRTINRTVFGAETFISRSGVCPLSISLVVGNNITGAQTHEIINTLASYSQRWQNFDLTIGRLETVRSLNRIKGALPLLVTLTLGMLGGFPSSEQNAFEVAPSLRNVHIYAIMPPLQINLPWSQLTSLIWSGGTLRLQDYIDLLRSCPNLTFCSFQSIPVSSSIIDGPQLTHLNLRSLRIPLSTDIHGFFGCLTLPALRALRVDNDAISPWAAGPFISFLARSSCVLEVAILEMRPIETLIQCLETIPGLIELEIVTPLNFIAFVKVMQRLSYDLPLAPRLCRNLRAISLPNDSSLDLPALFAFLKSRRNPKSFNSQVALLQSIRIVCSSMPELDLLVGLQGFQDEGLLVSVNDTHGVSWFSGIVL
jgi:hypothetical protein